MSWLKLFCWDGLLPSVVALVPAFVCQFVGRNHLFALLVAVTVPVSASLIRAAIGPSQLQHAGPPWFLRQVIFAIAVALLFALELVSSIGQLSEPLPTEVWCLMIACYLLYFGLMALAFRPFPLGGSATGPAQNIAQQPLPRRDQQ